MQKISIIVQNIFKNLIYSIPLSFIFFLIFYVFYNFQIKDDNVEDKEIISLKVYPLNTYSFSKLESINFEIKDLFKKNDEVSVGYDFLLNRNQEEYLNLFKHNLLQSITKLYPEISFQLYDERNNIPYYNKKNFKIIIHTNKNKSLNENKVFTELLNYTTNSVNSFLEINKTKENLINRFAIISKNINSEILSIKNTLSRLEYNLNLVNNLLSNDSFLDNSCSDYKSEQLLNFILLYQQTYVINEELLDKCTFYLEIIKEKTLQALLSFENSYRSIQHLDKLSDLSDEQIFLSLIDRFHKEFKYIEYDLNTIKYNDFVNDKEFNLLEYILIYVLLLIISNFLVIFLKKIRNEFS